MISFFRSWWGLSSLVLLAAISAVEANEIEGTALPFKSVTVSATAQGIIADAPVDEGDSVQEGDVLLQLRDDQEQLELDRYDQLIQQAEREYLSAKRLADAGSGTAAERDELETEWKRLQSEKALVQLRKDEKKILSPMDGIVVVKLIEAGESVESVEDIFEVIDIDTIQVRIYLPAEFLKRIELGTELPLTFPAHSEDEEFTAKVDFIDSRVDAASGLVRVKLLMENPDRRIKAGMRAAVQLPDTE